MSEKLIICGILFIFISMQLAEADQQKPLKCYTCDSPSSCRSPTPKVCDEKQVNASRLALSKHFTFEPYTSKKFQCFHTNYSLVHNNKGNFEVSGCAYDENNACGLYTKDNVYLEQSCSSCTQDLCNPAGTFSSSLTIMMSSLLVLLLLKCCCQVVKLN